jgi:hypothetical protein
MAPAVVINFYLTSRDLSYLHGAFHSLV